MKEYIVKKEDIGKGANSPVKTTCGCCHTTTTSYPFEPLGRVLPQDVGKMCVKRGNLWYVENDSQFEKRIANLQKLTK